MESRRRFIQLGGLGAVAAGLAACNRQPSPAANAANQGGNQKNTAAFNVNMRFFGLFGLVTGTETSGYLNRAEVLFLSAARSSDAENTPQHLPQVRIRRDAVTSPEPDEVDPVFPEIGIWKLEDCQVEFPRLSGNIKVGPPAQVDCPDTPNPRQWQDLKWVADLSAGLGRRAVVRRDCVQGGNLNMTPVATRFALAGGILEAMRPTYVKYQPAYFKLRDNAYRRPMTDLVQFTATQVADFIIKRIPYTGGATDIVLKAPSSGSPVYVVFQNTMNPEAIGKAHIGTMGHFKRLYDFYDQRLAENLRYVPEDARKCELPHDEIPDYPVYCPPARLYFS